jgi:hypothetical protein
MLKTYKTICRLDYSPAFHLIDNLGKFAEFFHQETSKPPFSKAYTDVNLVGHSITGTVAIGEDRARINLALNSLDALAEHKVGFNIEKINDHPVFPVLEKLIAELERAGVTAFLRIGLRVWIVVERDEFSSENLLNFSTGLLKPVESVTVKNFGPTYDVGFIIESKSHQGSFLRTIFGPYDASEKERTKYFSLNQEIGQGLILDVDFWQQKLEVPKFSMTEYTKSAKISIINVVSGICDNIAEQVK